MATNSKEMSPEEWEMLAGIGALFKEMREEAGLQQREAAKIVGTSQARIPVLEKGQADIMITTLMRHAYAYGYRLEVSVVKDEIPTIEESAA